MKYLYTFFWLFLFVAHPIHNAYSIERPSERLSNPILERKAEAIDQKLRCLVCQNESIGDSSAPLAQDLRHIVREKLASGQSEDDILTWMHQRYGDFILLEPPLSWNTLLLWSVPFLALTIAIYLARKLWNRTTIPTIPLTKEERSRLDDLLKKD